MKVRSEALRAITLRAQAAILRAMTDPKKYSKSSLSIANQLDTMADEITEEVSNEIKADETPVSKQRKPRK